MRDPNDACMGLARGPCGVLRSIRSNHKCMYSLVKPYGAHDAWCEHENSTGVKFLRVLHSVLRARNRANVKIVRGPWLDVTDTWLIRVNAKNSLIDAEWRIYASINQPPLVPIMACCLAGAKQLSEPMLEYCYWTMGINFGEILIKIHIFSFKKVHLKMSPRNSRPFCIGYSTPMIDKCQALNIYNSILTAL